MTPKNIVTTALFLFIGISIGVLVARGLREAPAPPMAAMPSTTAGDPVSEPIEPTITDGVVAYYFHGKTRCVTCNTIEAYAAESIEANFADQLEAGSVEWRVVNFELPANQHFAEDFELIASSVVLVRMQDGSQADWKNLTRVWELVGDKDSFVKYIEEETRLLLEGTNT